jgi:hypothetical protein
MQAKIQQLEKRLEERNIDKLLVETLSKIQQNNNITLNLYEEKKQRPVI